MTSAHTALLYFQHHPLLEHMLWNALIFALCMHTYTKMSVHRVTLRRSQLQRALTLSAIDILDCATYTLNLAEIFREKQLREREEERRRYEEKASLIRALTEIVVQHFFLLLLRFSSQNFPQSIQGFFFGEKTTLIRLMILI